MHSKHVQMHVCLIADRLPVYIAALSCMKRVLLQNVHQAILLSI